MHSFASLVALSVVVLASLTACGSSAAAPDDRARLASETASSDGGLAAYVSGTGTDGLRVRAEPSTSSAQVASLAEGQTISIACQVEGESVAGTSVWDYVPAAGGYVSDAYVYTGYDGFAPGAARCDGVAVGSDTSGAVDTGGDAPPAPASPASPASSSLVAKAIAEARSHLGYVEGAGDCNMFSSALGRGCEEWCSDFVDYVWMRAGLRVDGISGYSGTIYDYGVRHGTVKSPSSANVEPGDAVLWGALGGYSAHVGMVTSANADGSITVIHGNFGVGPGGAGAVYEGTISRSDTVQTGYGVYAFVSPVAK